MEHEYNNKSRESVFHVTGMMETETLILPAIISIVVGFSVLVFLWRGQTKKKTAVPIPVACPNPNCVRCIKYRQVQQNAVKRLVWVTKEVKQEFSESNLDRVVASIRQPQVACTLLQAPTVLMVADLPSKEVVTDCHLEACRSLEEDDKMHSQILNEIESTPTLLWNINDSPSGSWEVLPLMNQGTWNPHVMKICPILCNHIKRIPSLMDGCLFGNAMISKILPGTTIEPHCGPTNSRHRLQYALKLPKQQQQHHHQQQQLHRNNHQQQKLSLHVGNDHQLEWKKARDIFVFDDSFVHWVNYYYNYNDATDNYTRASTTYDSSGQKDDDNKAGSDDEARIVLILDLWHPDLTKAERKLIQYLYPPLPDMAS